MILQQLHHPFLVGGMETPLFLDVSPAAPRQWFLVGEDDSAGTCRVPIPRRWVLELLWLESRRSDEERTKPDRLRQLIADAEADQEGSS